MAIDMNAKMTFNVLNRKCLAVFFFAALVTCARNPDDGWMPTIPLSTAKSPNSLRWLAAAGVASILEINPHGQSGQFVTRLELDKFDCYVEEIVESVDKESVYIWGTRSHDAVDSPSGVYRVDLQIMRAERVVNVDEVGGIARGLFIYSLVDEERLAVISEDRVTIFDTDGFRALHSIHLPSKCYWWAHVGSGRFLGTDNDGNTYYIDASHDGVPTQSEITAPWTAMAPSDIENTIIAYLDGMWFSWRFIDDNPPTFVQGKHIFRSTADALPYCFVSSDDAIVAAYSHEIPYGVSWIVDGAVLSTSGINVFDVIEIQRP